MRGQRGGEGGAHSVHSGRALSSLLMRVVFSSNSGGAPGTSPFTYNRRSGGRARQDTPLHEDEARTLTGAVAGSFSYWWLPGIRNSHVYNKELYLRFLRFALCSGCEGLGFVGLWPLTFPPPLGPWEREWVQTRGIGVMVQMPVSCQLDSRLV